MSIAPTDPLARMKPSITPDKLVDLIKSDGVSRELAVLLVESYAQMHNSLGSLQSATDQLRRVGTSSHA